MILLKRNPNLFPKTPTTFFNLQPFSSSKTLNPSPKSNPIAEFLTNSCGFSSHKAAAASKQIPIFTSVDQAHSVRHFLEHNGFAEPRIRSTISGYPLLLSADVGETLQPSLQILRQMGFSEAELHLVVESNPRVLVNPLSVPSVQFWKNSFGTSRKKMKKGVASSSAAAAFSRPQAVDIVSGIAPKIAMLMEYGHSAVEIVHIVKRTCCFVALMPVGRGMLSLSRIEWEAFDAKLESFKGFGWSDAQFVAALGEHTDIIHLPEEEVREKMKFLAERAGCERSYIVANPSLLALDLETRLRPRYYVMEMLKFNRVVAVEPDLLSLMKLSEKNFVNRFVLRYKERLPKLHDDYVALCAGRTRL